MTARPFTPETLADRWGCSSEKIRQMVKRGELQGFRLGKLYRIPANEVERVECLNTDSFPPFRQSVPLSFTGNPVHWFNRNHPSTSGFRLTYGFNALS